MAYSAILKPTDYFNTKLYTGNNSTNAQTGVGFQPDMVWFKSRSAATDHAIFDAVRGVTKEIRPNKSDYEDTASNGLTAFDSDGFTIGDWSVINANSATYASWNWKANGAGSANEAGSINTTSTSANTTSGVSIIQYTGNGSDGATIGHGLGVAPTFLIAKKLSGSESWYVGSSGLTSWDYKLYLDTADAQSTNTPPVFGGTAPTTTLITLGGGAYPNPTNASGQTYIMYAFAPIKGFSLMGSYTGNGNANGPLINTGFKPAMVIIKSSTVGSQDWIIIDNKRGPFNTFGERLYPNLSNAEDTSGEYFNFLSNGFKVQDNVDVWNKDSATYIYMAFAEHPFVSNTGGGLPTTAR